MKVSARQIACAVLASGVASTGFVAVATSAETVREADATAGARPPRLIKNGDFKFPRKLLAMGFTTGEVRVLLDIDTDGSLADHLIIAYTHYEFANEVSRTLARWRYEPAMIDNQPVASTLTLQVLFRVQGVLTIEKHAIEEPSEPGTFMFRARELAELDQLPRPLVRVAPQHPAPLFEPELCGRVRVEFYIDEQGKVRVPVVVRADDPRLGWAALGAIALWRFEIPRRGGHPVLVRAIQDFVFEPVAENTEQPQATGGGELEAEVVTGNLWAVGGKR